MTIPGAQYLPAVDAPKSTMGAVYAVGVPLVIAYAIYEGGMPEDWEEWLVVIVLAAVALGFLANAFSVQFAAAPAATA